MRNKHHSFAALILILSMLACNLPGGQATNEPDLIATITAQAQALEAASITPTASGSETPTPESTIAPQNTNPPQPTQAPPQPSAPSKPKNFETQGAASSISFSWKDDSNDESGFRIYQEGVSAPIASINPNTGTGGMSYNWTGLSCGFKGKFYIKAYNNQGESGSSNSKDGVTIPCVPTNLIATGQGNDISFNWAVANPHNEEGFRIYQQGTSAPVGTRGANQGSGGTNFSLTGLLCDRVGTFFVTAFNNAGESAGSNLFQAQTVPCGPSGFTITGTTREIVTYSWNDNAASETGYHLYVDDVLYATLSAQIGTGTISNDAFQQCGETHTYAVRAFNYAGESSWSEHVGATTLAC